MIGLDRVRLEARGAEQTDMEIAGQLAASFATEVRDLLELRAQAVQKLRDEALKARSWGGVAKILVEIHARLGEVRPATFTPRTIPENRASMTAEEAAAAAHAILRLRRERMRAALPATSP